MALYGAKLPVIAPVVTDNDTKNYPTYGARVSLGQLVENVETLNYNDVKFHADNKVCEEDHSFSDGELAVTVDELAEEVESVLYNIEVSEEMGLEFGQDNISNYIGFACLSVTKKGSDQSFIVYYYPKLSPIPQGNTMRTRESAPSFTGEQVKFKIRVPANSKYRIKKRFSTEEEAMAFYETLMPESE